MLLSIVPYLFLFQWMGFQFLVTLLCINQSDGSLSTFTSLLENISVSILYLWIYNIMIISFEILQNWIDILITRLFFFLGILRSAWCWRRRWLFFETSSLTARDEWILFVTVIVGNVTGCGKNNSPYTINRRIRIS